MAAGALLDALGERHLGRLGGGGPRNRRKHKAQSDERRPEDQRPPNHSVRSRWDHFLPFLPPAAAVGPPAYEMR